MVVYWFISPIDAAHDILMEESNVLLMSIDSC